MGSMLFVLTGLLLLAVCWPDTVIAAAPAVEVTCGSVIKLMHERTKFRLHSHEVAYGSGSGQQSVTAFPSGDDSNSYWSVHGPHDAECAQGEAFKSGSVVRFQHMATKRWLHSHLHLSPLSQNYEVSGFGDDNQSDGGDHWRVEVNGGGMWLKDSGVRFQHVETGGWLHSAADRRYGRPIAGQQEVCGHRKKSENALWKAAEGTYMPRSASIGSPEHGEL
ncbi:stromal cell-derived factor 2-like protein [Klebsormidium nitens]|uniref:Stromal cell-derived factor 2-like protein n=1 Tax=Klebsormidium nitens TaxID=105231 RepID=A0A1Y1IMV2_KLENI|nr:stromal cell-derived factor 2-like protein [Klebsormidium nitens]|eukprot:GAQ89937.1 stromal cell-derived factor 2-like protein [Klebsormidium nitens]